MHKKLFNILLILLLAFFCFSGCHQMGRMVGKAETGVEKLEKKIENAGKDFEKGYEKETSTQ